MNNNIFIFMGRILNLVWPLWKKMNFFKEKNIFKEMELQELN